MNLAFLGDAFDHWKGSLFESLQRHGLLTNFAVEPMASDLPAWQAADFALFARLLRVEPHQVIQHRHTLKQRETYFREIAHSGDLFLDADTGIATGRTAVPEQYVMPDEVIELVANAGRVVVVYQHVRARRVRDRVDVVLGALRNAAASQKLTRLEWSSYESGTVALLFLGQTSGTTDAIAGFFRSVLGRHAADRIRSSSDRTSLPA